MKTYLPRFTLCRALIGIGILALFLGWLRPDRAKTSNRAQLHPAEEYWYVEFQPLFYPAAITIRRQTEFDGVRWSFSMKTLGESDRRHQPAL